MRLGELQQRWSTRREEFARLGAQVDGAKVIDAFLADLAETSRDEADQLLSIREAARLSGYSVEHLARSVRRGRIPNSGRKNKPLIRRNDLPQKVRCLLARGDNEPYDVIADARSLMSRQGGRNYGASKP